MVPAVRNVFTRDGQSIGQDHDQHTMFAIKMDRTGETHGPLLVDLSLEGLDQEGNVGPPGLLSNGWRGIKGVIGIALLPESVQDASSL